ncbi:MAG: hypothetical protein C0402_05450 [Thermodesulfovibrio sp.]|nr:hypothetical protein [Thermodesulfovibrio sp.]
MVAAAIAEKIGESQEKVKARNVDWAAEMIKRGVLIELTIGRTRFQKKMTKTDLGLDDITDLTFEKFMSEYYDLGSKLLIPKRVLLLFNKIENRARRNLYAHSFQTPWGHFVPCTAYLKWKERNEGFRLEYEKAKGQLQMDMPELTKEILEEYRHAAAKLYDRTLKNKTLEKFTEDFLKLLESQIPTFDEIADTFYFDWDVFYVPLPNEIEEEFLKAEVTRSESTIQQAKTRAEVDKVRAEVQMHKDTVSKILESKREKIDSLMDSVSGELRGAIFTTLKDVLANIKSRSVLSSSSIKSLAALVERTRMMNFMGDDDIEKALLKIEEVLTEKFRGKSIKDVTEVFVEIATEFRQSALEKSDLPDMDDFGYLL